MSLQEYLQRNCKDSFPLYSQKAKAISRILHRIDPRTESQIKQNLNEINRYTRIYEVVAIKENQDAPTIAGAKYLIHTPNCLLFSTSRRLSGADRRNQTQGWQRGYNFLNQQFSQDLINHQGYAALYNRKATLAQIITLE